MFDGVVLDKRQLARIFTHLGTLVGVGGPILLSMSKEKNAMPPNIQGVCDLQTSEMRVATGALEQALMNATCNYRNITIGELLDAWSVLQSGT